MSQYDFFLPQAMTLVNRGELTIAQLLNALSVLPARILGMTQSLQEGQSFNAVLFNPEGTKTVTARDLRSRGQNPPVIGRTVTGQVSRVFADGQQIC